MFFALFLFMYLSSFEFLWSIAPMKFKSGKQFIQVVNKSGKQEW